MINDITMKNHQEVEDQKKKSIALKVSISDKNEDEIGEEEEDTSQ